MSHEAKKGIICPYKLFKWIYNTISSNFNSCKNDRI